MELPNMRNMLILAVIIAILTWLAINLLAQPIYDLGACTINNFDCGGLEWDGACTDEIKDECCMEVRMCEGVTDDPALCYTQYCEATGQMCIPEPVGDTAENNYECKCKSAYI